MITVYNDAKHLTLSANSWPSRVIANQKANRFQYNVDDDETGVTYYLQYVTPSTHALLLESIVGTHSSDVYQNVINARALSIRVDGSVDQTHVNKTYVLGKTVTVFHVNLIGK